MENKCNIKRENYFMDFIRFLCALIIMFYHGRVFANSGDVKIFEMGYLAVNFYFILTGFLMVNSLMKSNRDTISFMKNKIKRLAPGILVCFFICYLFTFGRKSLDLKNLISNDVLGDLLQLKTFGLGGGVNLGWWYMSAMLFIIFLLYPIAKKNKEQFTKYTAPIIILVTVAIVKHFKISFTSHSTTTLIFTDGFYKGLVYISLGCISYDISKYFEKINVGKLARILLTIFESSTFALLMASMHFKWFETLIYAIFFTLAVAISFSNKTYTSSIFKHKIWKKLGNFGFYLYLTHVSIRTYIDRKNTFIYSDMLLKFVSLSIIVAIFVYFILEFVYPRVKSKISKNKSEKII